MKKILIVIFIIAAFLGGAGYWYLEIYQPRQFAKEFVIIYRDFQVGVRSVIPDQPLQGRDEKTWIKKYEAVTESARTKLNALKPPRKMKPIYKDFVEFLDAFELFISNFKSSSFGQASSAKEREQEQEQARRGNDLDSKIRELIRIYDLKPLTQ